MFTGIVQKVGQVVEASPDRIGIESGWAKVDAGESIAVNGVCLTATSNQAGILTFDLSPETQAKTALRDLGSGSKVNLERPMRADSMFGGHIVQGHVDATGAVAAIDIRENAAVYRFEVPKEYIRYLIEKGSVTVDGISLTVVDLAGTSFEVWIVPHTLEHTNLSERKVGDRVNLEFDVIAKYVERLLSAATP